MRIAPQQVFLLWLLVDAFSVSRLAAQPVSTDAKAIRASAGVELVPRDQRDADGVRRSDLRSIFDFSYRVVDNLDVGVDLPAFTIAPGLDYANPRTWFAFHLMHKPIWMAIAGSLEAPLLVNTHWRTDLYYLINVPFANKRFELMNAMGGRVAVLNTQDKFAVWNGVLIWNFMQTLALGPQAYVRYDDQGLDNYGFGARVRWHVKHNNRTLAAVYLTFTTPDLRFNIDEMTFAAISTWFWHLN